MSRFSTFMIFVLVVACGSETIHGQTFDSPETPSFGERLLTPFKSTREKVLLNSDGKRPILSRAAGRIRPKTAENKAERLKDLKADKALFEQEKLVKAKELALKTKEIALAEEKLAKEVKPWDVADPENLESPSPLLQMAAASKTDQDLAPKKIEALNYLAGLGCVLDPKVQDALMAGLKDYNADVRAAAVQAVISSYRGYATPYPGGHVPEVAPWDKEDPGDLDEKPKDDKAEDGAPTQPCSTGPNPDEEKSAGRKHCKHCKGERHFPKLFQHKCNHCQGGGCGACNYDGIVTEVYSDPCPYCVECESTCQTCSDSCKRCCTPEILEQLKKMAEGKDPEKDDCHFEPSELVRTMALEALSLCPGIPDKKTDEAPDDETPLEEKPLEENAIEESGLEERTSDEFDLGNPPATEPSKDNGSEIPFNLQDQLNGFDTKVNFGSSPFRSASYRSSNRMMLPAQVTAVYGEAGFLVELPEDYLIPQDSLIYLQNEAGQSQTAQVVESRNGLVAIELTEAATPFFRIGDALQFGILR